MSDDDIDLDRVIVDPEYRRKVIAFLNASGDHSPGANAVEENPGAVERSGVTVD